MAGLVTAASPVVGACASLAGTRLAAPVRVAPVSVQVCSFIHAAVELNSGVVSFVGFGRFLSCKFEIESIAW